VVIVAGVAWLGMSKESYSNTKWTRYSEIACLQVLRGNNCTEEGVWEKTVVSIEGELTTLKKICEKGYGFTEEDECLKKVCDCEYVSSIDECAPPEIERFEKEGIIKRNTIVLDTVVTNVDECRYYNGESWGEWKDRDNVEEKKELDLPSSTEFTVKMECKNDECFEKSEAMLEIDRGCPEPLIQYFTINKGEISTDSKDVTLSIQADAKKCKFRNGGEEWPKDWDIENNLNKDRTSEFEWTLSDGKLGERIVEVKCENDCGGVTEKSSSIIFGDVQKLEFIFNGRSELDICSDGDRKVSFDLKILKKVDDPDIEVEKVDLKILDKNDNLITEKDNINLDSDPKNVKFEDVDPTEWRNEGPAKHDLKIKYSYPDVEGTSGVVELESLINVVNCDCKIDSLEIKDDGCKQGGLTEECEEDDEIVITGRLKGSSCSSVTHLQIDASGGGCGLEFVGGDIKGINISKPTVSGSGGKWDIEGIWAIPEVPSKCKGNEINPDSAGIYFWGNPETGTNVNIVNKKKIKGFFTFVEPADLVRNTLSGKDIETYKDMFETKVNGDEYAYEVCEDSMFSISECFNILGKEEAAEYVEVLEDLRNGKEICSMDLINTREDKFKWTSSNGLSIFNVSDYFNMSKSMFMEFINCSNSIVANYTLLRGSCDQSLANESIEKDEEIDSKYLFIDNEGGFTIKQMEGYFWPGLFSSGIKTYCCDGGMGNKCNLKDTKELHEGCEDLFLNNEKDVFSKEYGNGIIKHTFADICRMHNMNKIECKRACIGWIRENEDPDDQQEEKLNKVMQEIRDSKKVSRACKVVLANGCPDDRNFLKREIGLKDENGKEIKVGYISNEFDSSNKFFKYCGC
ncbi:MAG: hypothetical protein ABEK17_04720, partial [Candidatus Aenigmatarchaeota archaeon]